MLPKNTRKLTSIMLARGYQRLQFVRPAGLLYRQQHLSTAPLAERSSSGSKSSNELASLIDGRAIARAVLDDVKALVKDSAAEYGRAPRLGVILVGDRLDSAKYVSLKEKAARKCGILTDQVRLPASASEAEVVAAVSAIDKNHDVDGVLVQLPLPRHVCTATVLRAVSASKDVDGFHPTNLGALTKLGEDYRKSFRTPSSSLAPQQRETATPSTSTSSAASSSSMKSPPSSPLAARVDGEYPPISLNSLGINAPCTALGCIELLDRLGVSLKGKHVVVVGRSNVVGLPLSLLALHRDATVTVCHVHTPQDCRLDDPLWDTSYTSSSVSSTSTSVPPPPLPPPGIANGDSTESLRLENACALADVLIVAAGSAGLVQGHWVKPGAVVIDVGFNVLSREEAHVRGLLSPQNGSATADGSNSNSSRSTKSNSSDGDKNNTTANFVCGDVRFESARTRAAAITPVPGGVGPMTVAMLMRNTVQTFLRRQREQQPWRGL